jgi:hypothetical protein
LKTEVKTAAKKQGEKEIEEKQRGCEPGRVCKHENG